jgi:hypothetical protein
MAKLGDVLDETDHADDRTVLVEQRLGIGEQTAFPAIGVLDRDFALRHGRAAGEHLDHDGLAGGQPLAIREGPQSAWSAAPELGCTAIVVNDRPVRVTNVDPDRQAIEKPFPRPEETLQRRFTGRRTRLPGEPHVTHGPPPHVVYVVDRQALGPQSSRRWIVPPSR